MARRSFWRDESGASLVETALVFPMFLAMLIGTLQIGAFGWTIAAFDNALVVAARKIRTGQADGPVDADSFIAAICGILNAFAGRREVAVSVAQAAPVHTIGD